MKCWAQICCRYAADACFIPPDRLNREFRNSLASEGLAGKAHETAQQRWYASAEIMETVFYSRMPSPVGQLLIGTSEEALVALEFDRGLRDQIGGEAVRWELSERRTDHVRQQLAEYFVGKRRDFSLKLDLRGPDFFRRCWNELLRIPYGETRTYGEIARAVGCPKGFSALSARPITIILSRSSFPAIVYSPADNGSAATEADCRSRPCCFGWKARTSAQTRRRIELGKARQPEARTLLTSQRRTDIQLQPRWASIPGPVQGPRLRPRGGRPGRRDAVRPVGTSKRLRRPGTGAFLRTCGFVHFHNLCIQQQLITPSFLPSIR